MDTRMAVNIPCLVCNTLVFDTDDKQSLSSSLSYLEDKKITIFLLRSLLEIPKQLVNFGDESSEHDNGRCSITSCSRFLVTCEQCKESVNQASLIYSQIRELAQRFRGIQKKIVEALKTCSGVGVGGPEVTDAVAYYRKLVYNCDFSGSGFPFIVQDEDDELVTSSTIKESGSGSSIIQINKNKDNLLPRKAEYCEVVVKEEENDESGNQEILLLFPEVEGDDDQVIQSDSEEEGSDFSELDSQDDDDEEDHFSEGDSKSDDDQNSQVESEEDDDGKEDEGLPQKKQEAVTPANYFLSSFICKKCLERFATQKALEEHTKISHFKEERGKFPCPLEGCTKTYTCAGKVPTHFTTCHRKPPYICKDCKPEFSNVDQVRIHHKQTHHPLQHPILKMPEKIERQKNPLGSRTKVRNSPKVRKRHFEKPAKNPNSRGRGRPPKPPGQEEKPDKINRKRQRCHPDNPFPCPHCPCRLKHFYNLKVHLKNSHPNSEISIDELRLKFYPPLNPPTEPSLPEVRKSVRHKYAAISSFEHKYPHLICKRNSDGKYSCPWTDPSPCPKIFIIKTQLHRHIKLHHLNLPLFTCTWSGGDAGEGGQVCGRTFNTRNNYLEHYDEHRGTPGYKCEDCGMTFYRRNPFTRHKQKMHSDAKFICEICGRGFTCKEYLNLHINMIHKGQAKRYYKKGTGNQKYDVGPGFICDLCGKVLKAKENLIRHMEAVHEKMLGKYCCHLCDKRFRQTIHLNVHLWERHQLKVEGFEPKEKVARKDKFQCPVTGCRMLFLKKENLEKHGKRVHGEDGKKPGPFNCKYCGKNFFQRTKWQHCERVHENKETRPEKCEICGKGFPTKDHLKFHQKHTHKMQMGTGK